MSKKIPACNMCGLSCAISGPEGTLSVLEDEPGIEHFIGSHFLVTGGFESTAGNGLGALDDLDQYKFTLCEFCLDWLFEQFKVPPEVTHILDDVKVPFRPAALRVQQDEWRKGIAQFQMEKSRRDKARREVQAAKSSSSGS